MTKIYLAAPFFSEKQIAIIEKVEQALAANPTVDEVYSPRTHQDAQYEALSKPWANEIYHRDMDAVNSADAIIAIVDFDGKEVDPGTAYEIGAANILNKPIIITQLDQTMPLNIMITEAATAFLDTPKAIESYDFKNYPKIEYLGEYI